MLFSLTCNNVVVVRHGLMRVYQIFKLLSTGSFGSQILVQVFPCIGINYGYVRSKHAIFHGIVPMYKLPC